MILHTIIDHDIIWGDKSTSDNNSRSQIEYNDIILEVEEFDQKNYIINRIISTRPDDYLNPELQPGSMIKLDLRPNSQV